MTPPPHGAEHHRGEDRQADRAVQQKNEITRGRIARRLTNRPTERDDDNEEPGNQPMHRPGDGIVAPRRAENRGAGRHSAAGNATSTRPRGPKSATICAPRLVNTRPVRDPVVTIAPAASPPRPRNRL